MRGIGGVWKPKAGRIVGAPLVGALLVDYQYWCAPTRAGTRPAHGSQAKEKWVAPRRSAAQRTAFRRGRPPCLPCWWTTHIGVRQPGQARGPAHRRELKRLSWG